MKLFFTLCLAVGLSLTGFSQTTHDVAASGGGFGNPAPTYAPQFLTIELGDIVRWTNTQGSHNVYGNLDVFPSNPEGFSSGLPAGASWVFEHTFTILGVYDYHCTQGNHSDTQFGVITVVMPSSIEELSSVQLSVFPNPVADRLTIDTDSEISKVEVIDVEGRVVIQQEFSVLVKQQIISTYELKAGSYIVNVYTSNGQAIRRLVK